MAVLPKLAAWAGGLGLCAALGAPPAVAQTPTRDEPFPRVEDPRRWGPLLVVPRFAIDNIGYDDNVFLVSSNDSRTPRESDWVVRVGPSVKGQTSLGRRMMLTFEDKLAAEVFFKHPALNHLDNTFDGQFDLLVGPLLLTTKGRWSTMEYRPNSELIERTRQRELTASQTLRLFVGPFTDVSVSAARTRFRLSGETSYVVDAGFEGGEPELVTVDEALDRTQADVVAEVGWRPRARTRLFVQHRDREVEFRTERFGRDSTERRRMVGLEFSPSSRLSGRFLIGQARLDRKDQRFQYQPYDGPVAETQLAYRPTGSTRVTLTYERQLFFSTFERNLYFREGHRKIEIASYLGSFFGLQGGYSRRNARYPEPGTGVVAPDLKGQKRRDETTDSYAGLVFRMRGGFEVGVRYGRRQRDSNYSFAVDEQRYVTTSGSYVF